jgi:hypothetical protein
MVLVVLNLILALVKLPAVDATTIDTRCADVSIARYCGVSRGSARLFTLHGEEPVV